MNDVVAAILAGGLGTRLRSVVADRPKVLAPVASRPFLSYLLDQLAAAGVMRCVLLTGYGAEQVREAVGDAHGGMAFAYSQEAEPLGTGGAVRLALPLLNARTVLLMNGDSFCAVDLAALLSTHRTRGAAATLTLTHVENASRYGRVEVDADDTVTGFVEKQPSPSPGWINAGVYALDRRLIEAIPDNRAVSLEREVLPQWVAERRAFGFRCRSAFLDIGIPEDYSRATAFFASIASGEHFALQ